MSERVGNETMTRGQNQPSDVVLELWLRDALRRQYAAIQHEPVPDCLLRLLEAPPRHAD